MGAIKVLIADDIILNRILIKEILCDFSCDVTEARNGKEAIDFLTTGRFDILFIDIEMPVMNGLETTGYIRKNMSKEINNMPIVALTAHNPDLYFNDFKKAGFDNLLTKPYTHDQIKTVLERFCKL
ncbi:MAG: response regulator [Bacteroidales bacterium]|nr:response regulator [Bacteroidales bacterium]